MNSDIAAISSQREEDRSVVESEKGPHLIGISIVVGISRKPNGRDGDVLGLCKC